jgi:hypothetical protein
MAGGRVTRPLSAASLHAIGIYQFIYPIECRSIFPKGRPAAARRAVTGLVSRSLTQLWIGVT